MQDMQITLNSVLVRHMQSLNILAQNKSVSNDLKNNFLLKEILYICTRMMIIPFSIFHFLFVAQDELIKAKLYLFLASVARGIHMQNQFVDYSTKTRQVVCHAAPEPKFRRKYRIFFIIQPPHYIYQAKNSREYSRYFLLLKFLQSGELFLSCFSVFEK